MARRWTRIRDDIRRGRHADAYLAAAAAAAVGVAGLAGLDLRWVAPVLLLCMIPVINLALTTDARLEDETVSTGLSVLTEFPQERLRGDWARSCDLLLVGVTLIRTVRNHEGDIARRLAAGRVVRVLVVNPADPTAMTLTDRRRRYGPEDPEGNAHEVRITLAALAGLADGTPDAKLAVRVIDFPIGIGGLAFAPDRPDARLYVETYPFKTGETQPRFVVEPAQWHWFNHFTAELENMWKMGTDVEVPGLRQSSGQSA